MKNLKKYTIPNFVLFQPTSSFLPFSLTFCCHFTRNFYKYYCLLLATIVYTTTGALIPFFFPKPNCFLFSLSLLSLLKSSLLPLRCSGHAILDLLSSRKNVKSVARSAKRQKARCGMIVVLPELRDSWGKK